MKKLVSVLLALCMLLSFSAAAEEETDLSDLPLPDKVQIDHKYNEFIPQELLRKQFIHDFLDLEGLKKDLRL